MRIVEFVDAQVWCIAKTNTDVTANNETRSQSSFVRKDFRKDPVRGARRAQFNFSIRLELWAACCCGSPGIEGNWPLAHVRFLDLSEFVFAHPGRYRSGAARADRIERAIPIVAVYVIWKWSGSGAVRFLIVRRHDNLLATGTANHADGVTVMITRFAPSLC